MTKTDEHMEPHGIVVTYFSMRFSQVLILCLEFCLLLSACTAPRAVIAQAATTVSFSPASAVIDTRVGSTTVVDVLISNAANVGGFDIQINYDPNVARISQWAPGDFLIGNLFCVPIVNIPGTWRLACTKTSTPGNDGSGTLVKLTFETIAWGGNSRLSFGLAELTESENFQLVDVVVEPGELRVIPYHIALPLILKQGGPQTYLVPTEALAQASALQKSNEFSLALPGCAEACS